VVFDNLSTGFAESVQSVKFIHGDLLDREHVSQVLRDENIDAVMHFAACALVGESVAHPAKYYENNVVAACHLLEAMRANRVRKMVFSSTCATYGIPQRTPITEDTPQQPVNPYGFTKFVIEQVMEDYAAAYEFGFAALRYFNASGASPLGDIGEDHVPETHLIPIVLQTALGQRPSVTIFGDDYPTFDGTCIRDYVHVDDLCAAHLAALDRLQLRRGIKVNLGTGTGYSVRQVIEVCRQVTGCEIPIEIGPRRAGDPPELVADAQLAREILGWTPKYQKLRPIVETAWRWHRTHPDGYAKVAVHK
jgi:UDP-glucose 4-epimerase